MKIYNSLYLNLRIVIPIESFIYILIKVSVKPLGQI